jgi:hypothetical protein
MSWNLSLSLGSDFQQPAISWRIEGGQSEGGQRRTPSRINCTTCWHKNNQPLIINHSFPGKAWVVSLYKGGKEYKIQLKMRDDVNLSFEFLCTSPHHHYVEMYTYVHITWIYAFTPAFPIFEHPNGDSFSFILSLNVCEHQFKEGGSDRDHDKTSRGVTRMKYKSISPPSLTLCSLSVYTPLSTIVKPLIILRN